MRTCAESCTATSSRPTSWSAPRAIVTARTSGTLERAGMVVRRRPAVAAAYALTAAVLVLAGFGGTVARLWRAAERERGAAVLAREGEVKARAVAEGARDGEARARAE